MNSFTAIVEGQKTIGEKNIVSLHVPRKYGDKDGVQFVDVVLAKGSTAIYERGDDVVVSYDKLPEARGYQASKVNPKTGQPYINAVVQLYDPQIVRNGGIPAPVTEDLSTEIPFHHIPRELLLERREAHTDRIVAMRHV